ncbi:MAG: hypothetical protein KF685_04480 [Acidobacteria bacterium]|nr:hypothetical protein [Acidobacteriota bacterium]
MSKKYHVERREFLNKFTNLRAYIIAVVEDAREKNVSDAGNDEWHEITLKLADCANEIELYFDLSTMEERENSLYKIQTLADVINEFRDAVEREIAVINAGDHIPQKARTAGLVH